LWIYNGFIFKREEMSMLASDDFGSQLFTCGPAEKTQ
jgi:hypothetical protein